MNLLDTITTETETAINAKRFAGNAFAVDASAVDNENKAMVRINELVERGRSRAMHVIERVQAEVPVDYVSPSDRFRFSDDGRSVRLTLGDDKRSRSMHDHAFGQVGQIAGAPWVRDLATRGDDEDNYGAQHAAAILNDIFSRAGSRHLVRTVEGKVRGVVSDKFRRIDARPILDAALGAFGAVGLVPYDGRWLETKMEIQAIIPQLFRPAPGELIAFGLSLRTSDYGDGAFDIRAFILRPACANGMIGESQLRAVHVGKRLAEDLNLSQKTYDLDTQTMASATNDVIRASLSPERIEARLTAMRAAHDKEVDPARAVAALRKSMTKEETEAVVAHFKSPDVVSLPAGNNALRMANAISWLANTTKNDRRALELQELAGEWIPAEKKAAA